MQAHLRVMYQRDKEQENNMSCSRSSREVLYCISQALSSSSSKLGTAHTIFDWVLGWQVHRIVGYFPFYF